MTDAVIGDGCIVSESAQLFGTVEIGENSFIDENVRIGFPRFCSTNVSESDSRTLISFLQELAKESAIRTVIGANSIIRSNSTIYQGTLVGDHFDCAHNVTIREYCRIGNNSYFKVGSTVNPSVVIGDGVVISGLVGDRTVIENDVTSHGHLIHSYTSGERFVVEPAPVLRNGSFVGSGAIVIGGVEIGEYAQVAAGAIVVENIPAHAQVRAARSTVYANQSTLTRNC